MSDDRVNIKADKTTRDRLRSLKRDGETWDGLLIRAADALEDLEDNDQWPGAPNCANCGAQAHAWTVEDGVLLCGGCATGEIKLEF